jgi:hypothetical protein
MSGRSGNTTKSLDRGIAAAGLMSPQRVLDFDITAALRSPGHCHAGGRAAFGLSSSEGTPF